MEIVKYQDFLPQGLSSTNDEPQQRQQLYRVIVPKSTAVAAEKNVDKVVLIVDISSSMYYLMSRLKKAILSTVDLLTARKICQVDDVVLVAFESDATTYDNFKTVEELQKVVDELESCCCTNYNAALLELVKVAQKNERVVAVMFSDGEPNDRNYAATISEISRLAEKRSLLVHAIGLFEGEGDGVNEGESVLRSLVNGGSRVGYYQSIEQDELQDSMIVLVDQFGLGHADLCVNETRTRCDGFFVDDDDREEFVVDVGADREHLKCTRVSTLAAMLENGLIDEIISAFQFVLEYHLRDVKSFERVANIVGHVVDKNALLRREVERSFEAEKRRLGEEKTNAFGRIESGCNVLKEKSEIIARYNRHFTSLQKRRSNATGEFLQIDELCAAITQRLHLQKNATAVPDPSDHVAKAIWQFRDNAIAAKRKKLAKFSGKLQERNADALKNVDGRMQTAVDELVAEFASAEAPIPVPRHLEGYVDPVTLDDVRDVMLDKLGVFMLALNVERHEAGIVAPHRTKIVEVCGYSSCILNSMMQQEGASTSSLLVDFRGVAQGNAAVPLWINEWHWKKAKHVWAPFVAHAVTGNEMEYTRIQGETVLALVILHLRRLRRRPEGAGMSEYNRDIIRMVGETLNVVIEKDRWRSVMEAIKNAEECLNEEKISSVEVFSIFLEYVPPRPPPEKLLLLVAEGYKRRMCAEIAEKYALYMDEKLSTKWRSKSVESDSFEETSPVQSTQPPKIRKLKKSNRRRYVLLTNYPRICEKYLNYGHDDVVQAANDKHDVSRRRKTPKNFVKYGVLEDREYLHAECDKVSKKARFVLTDDAHQPSADQIMAIVLSVHKCICFGWDAFAAAGIPSGYSTAPEYRDQLLNWCEVAGKKRADDLAPKSEDIVLALLETSDLNEARRLIQNLKRNSQAWGVLVKVLFRLETVASTDGQQKSLQTAEFAEKKIPLHFELIMHCICNSFDPADYRVDKIAWRPKSGRRRRFEKVFSSSLIPYFSFSSL